MQPDSPEMGIAMRLWWLGLAAVGWVGVAQANFDETTLWKTIHIPEEFVKRFISNEKCRSDETYLRSCLAALDAVGSLKNPPQTFSDISSIDFEKTLEELISTEQPAWRSFLLSTALNAHMQVFDPYAEFNTSAHFLEQIEENEEIGGMGVDLEIYDGHLRIQSVIPHSPAERAGLKAGDRISSYVSNTGETVQLDGILSEEVYDQIGGAVGTVFQMEIWRDGEILSAQVPLEVVEIENIRTRVFNNIGYVSLRNFSISSACNDLEKSLNELIKKKVKGLILDLRDNGGGQVRVGVCVAGLFLGSKPVVKIVPLERRVPGLIPLTGAILVEEEKVDGWLVPTRRTPLTDLPLTVLVDGDSASAAEIVAGALRDHGRAWLIGDRTYGKGTNQRREPIDFFVENMWIQQTTAYFLLPSGSYVQAQGLNPDFLVGSQSGEDLSRYVKSRETLDLAVMASAPAAPALPERETARDGVQACVRRQSGDISHYEQLKAHGRADYPLAFANAVLDCEISRESAVLRH